MKLGIVITSNDAETVWNAFRLGVFTLKQGDAIRVFLLDKGVEAERLDTETIKVTAQMQAFSDGGSEILACGTYLQLHNQDETALCPISHHGGPVPADRRIRQDCEFLTDKGEIMFFKQLATKDSSLSYFFGCGGLGKAVAVDVVAGDEDWFIEAARQAKVAITHVIDTHIHADHYSGGRRLAQRVNAPYCLHESDRHSVHYQFEPLWDGQVLDIGNVRIKILHTPGHTPDSLCLLVTDRRRGEAPWFVVTGDTLFVGAIGRPDLAGREREMAGVLYDSLHTKLLPLPDEIEIYPGHQAGSMCGAGLSGKPSSTLGFEKRWNAGLSMDRAEFVDYLTREIPPRPAEMEAMVRSNLGLAD